MARADVNAGAIAPIAVPCSATKLVEAVAAANSRPRTVLRLASYCTYRLETAASTGSRGANGLPIINSSITMRGHATTIKRTAPAEKFRIVEVSRAGILDLSGITISHGDAGTNTGGGILNAWGSVMLNNSAVTGNVADNGAGISNDRGDVDITGSTVNSNATVAGGGGGAIYNDGDLRVKSSVITSNTANTSGGGVFNEQGGTTRLVNTTLYLNSAAQAGGGVYNGADSRVNMVDTTFTGNSAGITGGGVNNLGNLSLVGSRLTTNAADIYGGGLYNGTDGKASIDRSRIDANASDSGGGIFNAGESSAIQLRATVVRRNTRDECAPEGSTPGCGGDLSEDEKKARGSQG